MLPGGNSAFWRRKNLHGAIDNCSSNTRFDCDSLFFKGESVRFHQVESQSSPDVATGSLCGQDLPALRERRQLLFSKYNMKQMRNHSAFSP